MASLTSTIVVYEQDMGMSQPSNSPFIFKEIMVETPATSDVGDTFALTLADYGLTTLKSVRTFNHSTNYSVIVAGTASTSVTAGVLTLTQGGGANQKRTYILGGI